MHSCNGFPGICGISLKITPRQKLPSVHRSISEQRSELNQNHPVRAEFLAVFGNGKGIDLTQDRAFLDRLSTQAEIENLIEPSRSQLNDRLWQGWDMLFFAGHSSSQEKGLIQINPTDSLTVEQLRYGLQQASARWLKLAIFNSCDGSGLAQQLADLHIPQVIVMRKPLPDIVAHVISQAVSDCVRHWTIIVCLSAGGTRTIAGTRRPMSLCILVTCHLLKSSGNIDDLARMEWERSLNAMPCSNLAVRS